MAYGWLYIIYYGGDGDSLNYFKASSSLANIAFKDFSAYWQVIFSADYTPNASIRMELWNANRAFLMIRFTSLLHLVTFNNYWITGIYLSLFSYLGMFSLSNKITHFFPKTKYAVLLAFIFFPSIVFWSAGYTKESIAIAALSFALSSVLSLSFNSKTNNVFYLKHIIIILICLYMTWAMKFYYFAALAPTILSFFIAKFLLSKIPQYLSKNFIFISFAYLLVFLFFAGIATQSHYNLYLERVMWAIVRNHNTTYIFSHPDDLVHYRYFWIKGYITLYPSIGSLLSNFDIALFAGLFRPLLWEAGSNKLKLLLGLENILTLILFLYTLFYLIRKKIKLKPSHYLIVFAIIIYILILASILSFASPNLGTLARYKAGFKPFFILFITLPLTWQLYSKLENIENKVFALLKY